MKNVLFVVAENDTIGKNLSNDIDDLIVNNSDECLYANFIKRLAKIKNMVEFKKGIC